ncbi:hemolysin-type calcium-binding repeat family protein [Synechococcus sp. PROS-7-1]|uniref:S8 family serine peptidase n=1 Tax=Synechococcus sp. PROS-7-1 TaxID=1442556 RepID=UPI001648693A|nr:S8 family serine peptidase [Synechococcus sp. PROS-7-1]QNI85524.1 hemolysin-type calcium-binding repeat family protein [Synechococcus sp. PROS-7-1]
MSAPQFRVSPGFVEEEKINLYEYYNTAQKLGDGFHYIPFQVDATSNIFATLEGLPADFDLYLGAINPSNDVPDFWRNGTPVVYNSSTNPGRESETIFAQLQPGKYWLQIKFNTPPSNYDLLQQPFTWKIDASTFDETRTLSNDPYLKNQWHLFNTGISGNFAGQTRATQWIASPNADIRAPEAWTLSHDASDIIIAIIDEGFDTQHPDLIDNLWTNPREIPGNDNDDDDNGFKDDVHGWNFVDNSPNVVANDNNQHGTNVAGIAGAKGNNGIGVSGVAWDTQLMTLDVFGGGKGADDKNIANAIVYAVKNGAKVINMSLGGNQKLSPEQSIDEIDQELEKAFEFAYANDVFISIAAGNEGAQYENRNKWNDIGNLDVYSTTPAVSANKFGNIAQVASTNAQDLRSSFSNYGRSITISAPGGDGSSVIVDKDQNGQSIYQELPDTEILSTMPVGTGINGSDYGFMAGTSQAAPVIAGMAALIRAQSDSITAPETLAILRAGAVKNQRLEPYVDQGYQANLYESLEIAQQWQGPSSLTQIGQDQAPVFNLSYLTAAQRLIGEASVTRDAENDVIIGFYQVQDTDGTVFDALGNPVQPGDADYAYYALSPLNIVDEITNVNVANGQTQKLGYELTDASYLAPYAISDGNTWFAWSEANADGMEHFKMLGANKIGLEDLFGGGDQDFNDMVFDFVAQQIL